MMTGLDQQGLARLAEQLDRFRDALSQPAPPPGGWPAAVRTALEPLQAQETLSREPVMAEALARLVLIAEVWDCIGPEDLEATETLRTFFLEAADQFAAGALRGDPSEATYWILEESEARWGAYLAIIDPMADVPSASPEPTFEPIDPEGPPEGPGQDDLDAASLLRSLVGMAGGDRPEPGPAGQAEWAPPESSGPAIEVAPETPAADRSERPPSGPLDRAITAPPPPPAEVGPAQESSYAPDLLAEARSLALDPELQAILIADLSDLLARIQELVLGLGQGDDSGSLHELGRCYHTLKGASGSVGLTGLASEIHALEDAIEAGGGSAEGPLIRRMEESLSWIEGTLDALRSPAPSPQPGTSGPGQAACKQDEAPAPPPGPVAVPSEPTTTTTTTTTTTEGDGLIRVPAARFEELMDLCSELLTRRRVWAEQADRMKLLARSARDCSQRLRGSVERLEEALPSGTIGAGAGRTPLDEDLAVQVRRMIEQAEDLAALAATAREAAVPMAGDAEDLSRLSLRLWEGLQSVRIVPVRGLFQRLIRVARDAARVEGRTIRVAVVGEETGADRLLLDRAFEPLLHVVRNAVGHGIEAPEARRDAGKAPEGQITLEARREGNTVVLEVKDDGRGLDYEAIAAKGRRLGLLGRAEQPSVERLNALIFHSGFSTRGEANSVSGRGVGMDVVAREVEALRGRIELASQPGKGTRLSIRLPARIALEHMMVVRIQGQAFAVPTSAIDAVHRASGVGPGPQGVGRVAQVEGRRLPLIDLGPVLGFSGPSRESCPTVLLVTSESGVVALRVDSVDGPQELVLKPLGPLLAGNPAVSGAGLSTGGEVIPALDVAGLLRLARDGEAPLGFDPEPLGRRVTALVVDDSLSVRRIATRHLRALGFDVEEASDGEEALGKLRTRCFELVMTDLEMPRMDGFALLAELRRTGVLESSRVIVTSTLSDAATRRRVGELGAAAFVPKPVDPDELAEAVGPLLTHRSPATGGGGGVGVNAGAVNINVNVNVSTNRT